MFTNFTYMLAQEVGACVYSRKKYSKSEICNLRTLILKKKKKKKKNLDNCKKNEGGGVI